MREEKGKGLEGVWRDIKNIPIRRELKGRIKKPLVVKDH